MNRRSFFGFIAAAPVVPLMARGDEMAIYVETRVVDGNLVPFMLDVSGVVSGHTIYDPRADEIRALSSLDDLFDGSDQIFQRVIQA